MSTGPALPEFARLPLGLVDEPVLPSRSEMDDRKMDELVDSIRSIGLQQPIGVVRHADRYAVIYGHRRRIACERAGQVDILCRVYTSTDLPHIEIQASENWYREDLNPADEALWFHDLLERHCGGDIEQLCTLVRRKLSYVDNRLALARGYPDVFAALKAGEIHIGAAHELNKITSDHYRNFYLRAAIRGGATIGIVMNWVVEWKNLADACALPEPGTASEPAVPAGAPVSYFTCFLCGKNNHVHTMQQLVVHGHCKLAILDPLLEHARE